MTYFPYILIEIYNVHFDVLTLLHPFWRSGIILDVMTYCLTSRNTYLLHDVIVDVITYFWMLWHTFWHHNVIYVLFDFMTYFCRTFWYHDILSIHFDGMTCFMTYFVIYVLTSWRTLHTFRRYYGICYCQRNRNCENHIDVDNSEMEFVTNARLVPHNWCQANIIRCLHRLRSNFMSLLMMVLLY